MTYVRYPMARSILARAAWRQRFAAVGRALPRAIFVVSVGVLCFAIGFILRDNHWFPYQTIANAKKTFYSLLLQKSRVFPDQFIDWSGGDPNDVERNRIVVRAAAPDADNDEHFLLNGGLDEYVEYCPKNGCIAVEYARNGKFVHAYPYFPDQFGAHELVALPYETVAFRFSLNLNPFGLLKLPNGDLIVVFNQWNSFPYGGGIARVHPDGSVAWFRHDYSHHWPRLLPEGNIVVPSMHVGNATISMPLRDSTKVTLACNGKIMEDTVDVLTPNGHVLAEIPVLYSLLHSPYRGILIGAADPCDPLHLNYVAPVTQGIRALFPDVKPDDFIISLRNINAFAILGRDNSKIKHLFRGTFLRQHGVQPIGESATVLIFDDHGSDGHDGPSRFISYNLADHQERTLFPNPNAPGLSMYSDYAGDISISPNRLRAIVTPSLQGRAYEIRLSDGKVLTEFNDIQDLRNVPAAGAERSRAAARFTLYTAEYVR